MARQKRQVKRMADISKEIQDFREAVYGEEVRGSMISLAEKVNGEVEDNTDKVTKYGEAEQSRAQAETARADAEKARGEAEKGRVSAEASRVSSESARAKNEEGRISAEKARAEAEDARESTEAGRASAETARATAESGRVSAENARATAENKRDTSEEARASAEKARVEAENGRVSAENAREEAEANRQTDTSEAIEACDGATERANAAAQAAEDMVAGKGLVMTSEKGAANGVATLDEDAKIPQAQIDGSNIPITFEQAAQRANIQSRDSLAVAFGKLAKFCADLQPYAFAAPVNSLTETDASVPLAAPQGKELSDRIGSLSSLTTNVKTSIVNAINSLKSVVDGKLSISNVVNNLTTTVSGKALDARQGKTLSDRVGTLSNLTTTVKTNIVNAINSLTTSSYVQLFSGDAWFFNGAIAYRKCGCLITLFGEGFIHFDHIPSDNAFNPILNGVPKGNAPLQCAAVQLMSGQSPGFVMGVKGTDLVVNKSATALQGDVYCFFTVTYFEIS